MDKSTQAQRDEWQSRWMDAVCQVASTFDVLEQTNPWPEQRLLPQAMNYLMTELWDRGFSQTEIRQAFNDAVADMPRYAAGEEVRR